MPIVVTPDLGIPFPFDTTPEELEDFRERAHVYFNTVKALEAAGLDVTVTDEDRRQSHNMLATEKFPAVKTMLPGAIVNLEALLTEWDHEILDAKRRLRNFVTNKLITETNDPDPKVRLRALELLGKTTTVGMFSDKVEVNVTHRSLSDIETELKKTLDLYAGDFHEVVEDEEEFAAPVEEHIPHLADLDVDAELS